jgi:hypothetical protein
MVLIQANGKLLLRKSGNLWIALGRGKPGPGEAEHVHRNAKNDGPESEQTLLRVLKRQQHQKSEARHQVRGGTEGMPRHARAKREDGRDNQNQERDRREDEVGQDLVERARSDQDRRQDGL